MARRPWLILLLLPVLPLWQALSRGKTIGPWENIKVFAPWMGPVPNQPWDVLQADGALQFYVWRDLVFQSWRQFEVPFWNPYVLAGTPLLANSQSGALYPPHIVIGLLHLPTTLGVTLLAWLHLAVAGLGVYALAKEFGASNSGALLAGASFALCPFMLGWTGLASVISTVAWIPWVLLGGLRATSTTEPRGRSVILLAVSIAMMILAGHLQFCAYGMLALLILAATRIRVGGPRACAAVACGVILGGMVAAPQLLPVLEYSQYSHRRNSPTHAGYAAYVASAIQPYEFGTLVNPLALGNPRQMAQGANVASYWVPIVKPGANLAEAAVSPGAVALAFLCLLPIAWSKVRGSWGLALVGGVGLLLAVGSPLAKALYFFVPGWSSTGSPGRAIVLFVLALCVLGGLCVSAIEDPEQRPKTPKGIQLALLAFVFIVALTMGLGITGAKTPEGMDHNAFQALVGSASANGILSTMLIAIVAVQPILLGYFRSRGHTAGSPGVLIVGAVVAVALLGRADQWIMVGDLPPTPPTEIKTDERAAFINGPWDLLLVPPANFPSNLSALYRIREAGGYDSLVHRETVEALRQANGGKDPAPPANGNIMFVKRDAQDAALAELGVSWKVVPRPEGADSDRPINWSWERIDGPGRLSGIETRVLNESMNAMSLEVNGPGRLVVRDRMIKGWTATLDQQKPLPLADSRWIEVDIPEGRHLLHLRYEAPRFKVGLLFALLAGGAMVGLGFVRKS